MIRFTDKFSIYLTVACLGFYAYAVASAAPGPLGVLDRFGTFFFEPLFPLVLVAGAIAMAKLNILLVILLSVIGYTIAGAWPVEDFVALFLDRSTPVGEPPVGYAFSQLAWTAYAFIVAFAAIDVIRIAMVAVRAMADPGIRR